MKKFTFILVSCLLVVIFPILLTGCSEEKHFIGTFNSVWVEGNGYTSSPIFNLTISSDKTFTITKFNNETKVWTRTGTWAGNKSKENFGIVCFFKWTDNNYYGDPLDNYNYFTLTQLDNGQIVASTGISGGIISAGSIIVFEKK